MAKDIMDKQLEELVNAILKIETFEECKAFLTDICTIKELKDMAQRLEVAKMLRENIVYQKIATETGASTATISRVSRALNYGSDGYAMILDKLGDK